MILLQILVNGVIVGSIYGALAIPFAVLYRTRDYLNFFIAALIPFSALVGLSMARAHYPAVVALATAALAGGTLGALYELLVDAPLRRRCASPLVHCVASLCWMIVLINLAAVLWGDALQVFPADWFRRTLSLGGGIQILTAHALTILWLGLASLLTIGFLYYTATGLVFRALISDRTLALARGVDEPSFALPTAAACGAAVAIGATLAAFDTGARPSGGLMILLPAAAAAIVTSRSRLLDAAAWAIAIGILEQLATLFISSRWKDCATLVIIALLLLGWAARQPAARRT